MAPTSRRKLKVFQTQIGFYDTIVAAPNQTEALAAWGVRQNLFGSGTASITQDEAAIAAALKTPGVPLGRPAGSRDPFTVSPGLPQTVPATKIKLKADKPSTTPKEIPPPDRTELEAAEAAASALERKRDEEEAAFDQEEAALSMRRAEAKRTFQRDRKDASAALEKARREFKATGGKV